MTETVHTITPEIIAVFVILGIAVLFFATEMVRPDIVGLLIIVAVGLTGVLPIETLLKGFGNRAVITIAAMFVLSAALMRTGVVSALGSKLTEISAGDPFKFLLFSVVSVCFLSAFVNNTPVVVVFIPAVLTVCMKMGQSPSKFLMPISFASMLGGSCTLIGTSSNILISSLAAEATGFGLGMFEFLTVGIVITLIGLLYLLVLSPRLLPERITLASTTPMDAVKEYVTQVRITKDSHFRGKRLNETGLADLGINVVELIRNHRVRRLEETTKLQHNDILLMRGDLNKILELNRQHEIKITTKDGKDAERENIRRVEMTMAELMIAPESSLIGRTCEEVGLHTHYDVSVFALQRKGRHHQRDIAGIELRMGDILLVRGTIDAIRGLRDNNDFILLEGVHEDVIEKHKAPIAVASMLGIIILAAFGVFPISVLALAGVAIVTISGVLSPSDAYKSIDWPVLVLIAGMISLGHAMEKTGAVDIIANIFTAKAALGPHATLYIFYALASILSLLILNKPAAVLCFPVAVSVAASLGVSPKPFIMAVAFAASTAMATPMSYQTNLLVYGPGGYNFKDFLKFGLPLNIIAALVACIMIPLIWPFGSEQSHKKYIAGDPIIGRAADIDGDDTNEMLLIHKTNKKHEFIALAREPESEETWTEERFEIKSDKDPDSLRLLDVDEDGQADVIIGIPKDQQQIFRQTEDGSFETFIEPLEKSKEE